MMSETITILIVDDHPVVRDGLLAILGTQLDFEVVGEASSGPEALRKYDQHNPHVVLLDLEMPKMDGVEVIRRLRQSTPEAKVVVFTAFDTDERILGAVQAGAKGYLLKGAPRNELFNAIRVVQQGGALTSKIANFSEKLAILGERFAKSYYNWETIHLKWSHHDFHGHNMKSLGYILRRVNHEQAAVP